MNPSESAPASTGPASGLSTQPNSAPSSLPSSIAGSSSLTERGRSSIELDLEKITGMKNKDIYDPRVEDIETYRSAINRINRRSPSNSSSRGDVSSALSNYLPKLPLIGTIGVCAMDSKARSKPCRSILNKLIEHGEFETIIFGDKVILDENVENWPTCDFLICFFSSGFPLQKAIQYAELRKPFLVNDLHMQKILWDRRLVLRLLDACQVSTPDRIIVSRDGGPKVDNIVRQKLLSHGLNVTKEEETKFHMVDDDTMRTADGVTLVKPFVEKPVDGEDHNIFIYYHSKQGGGGRRLFRKVGNKSSEFDAELKIPRTKGSYIYERFMDTDNFEDVKAYTVGENFCHAETRKSPVVDGIVRRNTYGKELRFVTKLADEEARMARNICLAFEQNICGFDLLRVHGKSYVIDVNGFSFVKDNAAYYDAAAKILRDMFIKAKAERNLLSPSLQGVSTESSNGETKGQKWVLKSIVSVIRHADRTPKQKFKYSFKSKLFIDLLQGHKIEVIIRDKDHLRQVLKITELAIQQEAEDLVKLNQLKIALEKKLELPGTKVQIKPVLKKKDANGVSTTSLGPKGSSTPPDESGEVEKVQLIIKWGGEPTHSAQYQALDLGEQMRKDIKLLNKDLLDEIEIYTSSERRVIASARLFAQAFMDVEELPDGALCIRKDLLDDSNAAKDLMDKVKKKLKPMLRKGIEPPPQFTWPAKFPEPFIVLCRVVELMKYHKKLMDFSYAHRNVQEFQQRWCCHEEPILFKERWDKLFAEFVTVDKVDPSKISELYDTMKYDGLHNRQFLEHVFRAEDSIEEMAPPINDIPSLKANLGIFSSPRPNSGNSSSSGNTSPPLGSSDRKTGPFDGPQFYALRELYRLSKILFDFICPQEYGIDDQEKLDIGLLTSMPLLQQILADMERMKESETGGSSFYFTKESHIYTLLNVLYESQIPTKLSRNSLPELDYLTQIQFELYQAEDNETNEKKFNIKITISPGCNSQSPLDVQLDSKHCISCIPRQGLTRHLDSELVVSKLKARFNRVNMPKKFIPVNISGSKPAEPAEPAESNESLEG